MPRANHYVGLKSFKPSQETMDEAICADRSRYLLWFLPVSNPTDNPKLFISGSRSRTDHWFNHCKHEERSLRYQVLPLLLLPCCLLPRAHYRNYLIASFFFNSAIFSLLNRNISPNT